MMNCLLNAINETNFLNNGKVIRNRKNVTITKGRWGNHAEKVFMACFLLLEYIFCFLYYPYSKLFSSSSIIDWFSLFFIYRANPDSSTIYTHDSLLKLSEFFFESE